MNPPVMRHWRSIWPEGMPLPIGMFEVQILVSLKSSTITSIFIFSQPYYIRRIIVSWN